MEHEIYDKLNISTNKMLDGIHSPATPTRDSSPLIDESKRKSKAPNLTIKTQLPSLFGQSQMGRTPRLRVNVMDGILYGVSKAEEKVAYKY